MSQEYKSKGRDAQGVRRDRAVQPDPSARLSGLASEGQEKHHPELNMIILRI